MYQIAGLMVDMETFGRTLVQSEPYRHDSKEGEQVDIIIHSRWKKFQERYPRMSEDLSEYISTGSEFYRNLLLYNGMMLHASAVMVDGYVYLFSAPCGTGKSTHAALWREYLGNRAKIINDDKPAIRIIYEKVYVYGTPWSGKTDQNLNMRGELAGIAVVRRSQINQIRRLGNKEAIFALFDQTIRPRNQEMVMQLFDVVGQLVERIPIYELSCNMELDAAKLAYETMAFSEEKVK